ncbi:haloacid dehalogenase-like hydrolase-domain-containing protein [Hypoxylon rubiginosum]|uniref:Haloacid dehalogenase-like hydrolase-domain-containing protein n=1 Tax=Hypoxylon rubiginosum TaxID=110542 RepID=A0ACB9YXU2_9PEZI|nr:haloacid dehalogenase-like hydrolase-domain-containing protein [Hypoxylon rubiginosum]
MSIFLDFDGTITAKDTVGELANFALRVRAAEGQDLRRAWDDVVAAYVGDHRAHVAGYVPPAADRCLPAQEVEFLRRAKGVETSSLARVGRSRLFRGIGAAAFREAGRALVADGTVELRPGFRRFVRDRVEQGWRVWVLSVNWSAAFIEGACGGGRGGLPGLEVVANEVRDDGSVAGPAVLNPPGATDGGGEGGEEPRNLTNSRDKLDAMEAVLAAAGLAAQPSIYFGDSTTDLECLLAVDRGFVVSDREDSSLLRTLRRIGKEVPHVRDQTATSKLAWTSDYEDLPDDMFALG